MLKDQRLTPVEGASIDRSNPLASGLVFFQAGKRDLVSGREGLALPAGLLGASDRGASLQSTTTNTGGWAFSFDRHAQITQDLTILAFVQISTLISNSCLVSIPYRSSGWTLPFCLGLARNNATTAADLSFPTSSTTRLVATSATSYLVTSSAFVCYAVTRSGSTVRFYRNGVLFSTVTGFTTSAVESGFVTGQQPIAIMNRSSSSTGGGLAGRTAASGIWGRALSDGEIKTISESPMQMLLNSFNFQPFF